MRSGLFGALSLGGAILNYATYPVLAHILSAKGFGDFTVIIALSNQVLGILLVFNIVSIYLVKSMSKEVALERAQLIQKLLIRFFLVLTVILLILSPVLSSWLKVHSPLSFILLGAILVLTIPSVVWTGYLQGHKELVRVGVFNLINASVKLVAVVTLAIAFGPTAALVGVLVGSIGGILALLWYPGVTLPRLGTIFHAVSTDEKQFIRGIGRYILGATLVVGGLSLLQNFDIVLAKIKFTPVVAGQYSGISILSNALYYLALLLIWVVLPEIQIKQTSTNHRVLGTAFKLLGLIAASALIVEVLFRKVLLGILLGHQFAELSQALIFATLYQLSLAGITLYAYYLIVIRRRQVSLLALLIGAGCLLAAVLPAANPAQMVEHLWLSLLGGLIVYLVLSFFFYEPSSQEI